MGEGGEVLPHVAQEGIAEGVVVVVLRKVQCWHAHEPSADGAAAAAAAASAAAATARSSPPLLSADVVVWRRWCWCDDVAIGTLKASRCQSACIQTFRKQLFSPSRLRRPLWCGGARGSIENHLENVQPRRR